MPLMPPHALMYIRKSQFLRTSRQCVTSYVFACADIAPILQHTTFSFSIDSYFAIFSCFDIDSRFVSFLRQYRDIISHDDKGAHYFAIHITPILTYVYCHDLPGGNSM